MKLLTVLFLFISCGVRAQTTPEIYNYISSGYITTIQQGLDFKKGYSYNEIGKGRAFRGMSGTNTYQFSYRTFFKEGQHSNILAFMVVLLKNGNVEKSFCLPAYGSDPSLFNRFWHDISTQLGGDQKEQLLSNITQLFTLMAKTAEKK